MVDEWWMNGGLIVDEWWMNNVVNPTCDSTPAMFQGLMG